MRFDSTALTLILGKLGAGSALFVFFQQKGEIRKSFFHFMGYLSGISFLLAAASMMAGGAWREMAFLRGSFLLSILGICNLGFGIFLLGWAAGAMILGHWYLIMRGLSFHHLQRATLQLLWAMGLRASLFLVGWLWLAGSTSIHGDPLLLGMRAVWGLLVPAIFGFMAWKCAMIGSNQAATGLLYLVVVAVLIGEILASPLGF